MNILNLGAGKVDFGRWNPLSNKEHNTIIHVDRGFDQDMKGVYDVHHLNELLLNYVPTCTTQHLCSSDLFEFVDGFNQKFFDVVYAERIFEHMEYVGGEVGRLLEGINTITRQDVKMEIVVPNAILISKLLMEIESSSPAYTHTQLANKILIVNTENHNFKQDPHGSTWTPTLAKFYIESEGTWKVDKIEEQIKFAGRDIYMRIYCSKT